MLVLVLLGLCSRIEAFTAYDCNNISAPVEIFSLLAPEECPSGEKGKEIERVIWGEVIQMKQDRYIQVYRCEVIESVWSQYCGWNHAAGVLRPIRWREPRVVEPQDCRISNMTGFLKINGKDYRTTVGTTVSHSTFLVGGLSTVESDCSTGYLDIKDGLSIKGQAAQAVFEITVRVEMARVNDLEGSIKFDSGLRTKVGDGSIVDSLAGTYVWQQQSLACPDSLVSLYKGPVKVIITLVIQFVTRNVSTD